MQNYSQSQSRNKQDIFVLCNGKNQAIHFCLNERCQINEIFTCKQNKCSCNIQHQNCQKQSFESIKKLQDKIKKFTKQIKAQVGIKFNTTIEKFTKIKDQIILNILKINKLYQFSQDQINLLDLLLNKEKLNLQFSSIKAVKSSFKLLLQSKININYLENFDSFEQQLKQLTQLNENLLIQLKKIAKQNMMKFEQTKVQQQKIQKKQFLNKQDNNIYYPTKNMKPQQYKLYVDSVIQTIQHNILTDYQQDYQQNIKNKIIREVIQFYKTVYQKQQDQSKRKQVYQDYKKEKENILTKEAKYIIKWFQTKRGNKYNGPFVGTQCKQIKQGIQKYFKEIKELSSNFCKKPHKLQKIPQSNKNFLQQQLINVQRANSPYSIKKIKRQQIGNKQKYFLLKKKKDLRERATLWIVQIAKDGRFIWRGTTAIDALDVQELLKFLLQSRQNHQQQCPSILINVGTHGYIDGSNAFQKGQQKLLDQKIVQQTQYIIYKLLNLTDFKSILSNNNINSKIYLHSVCLEYSCIYSPCANHIIDVQCHGANSIVTKQSLMKNRKSQLEQDDLLFLNKDRAVAQLFKQSSIIQLITQERRLLQFFKAGNMNVAKIELLYKASLNDFSTVQYLKSYGKQTHTLFICITNKDKIIGAYSPLYHLYNEKKNQQIEYASDETKKSFIFSLTENHKFQLQKQARAIIRSQDKNQICFGNFDFMICNSSKKIEKDYCCSQINNAYFNKNYEHVQCGQQYRRFNGNNSRRFSTKEWQAWKIQMKQ